MDDRAIAPSISQRAPFCAAKLDTPGDQLVGQTQTLDLKMTCSCGDLVFAFESGDSAVAVGAVAVGDVAGDGALGGVPVG